MDGFNEKSVQCLPARRYAYQRKAAGQGLSVKWVRTVFAVIGPQRSILAAFASVRSRCLRKVGLLSVSTRGTPYPYGTLVL